MSDNPNFDDLSSGDGDIEDFDSESQDNELLQLIIARLSRLYKMEGEVPRLLEKGDVMSYFPEDQLTPFMLFAHDLCMEFNGSNESASLSDRIIQKVQSGNYFTTDEEIAELKEDDEDIETENVVKVNSIINDAVFETIQGLIDNKSDYAQVIRNFFLDPTVVLGKVGIHQACRTAVDILMNRKAEDYRGHSSFTITIPGENYEKWCAGAAVARMISRQARQAYNVLRTAELDSPLFDEGGTNSYTLDIIEARFKSLKLDNEG